MHTDEATSALDVTSRILVFEAIKRWRQNKTTIVITHDLSQITPTDFVYVLKDGEVVEFGPPVAECRLAARHGVELPIASAVADVLEGSATITEAMEALLARPLRQE